MRLALSVLLWVTLLPAAWAEDRKADEPSAEDKALDMIRRLKGTVRELDKGRALSVSLTEGPVTDADLALLKGLPRLRNLAVFSDKLTNDGLKHLAALPDLEVLSVQSPLVDDTGLKHLEKMTRLRILDLHCPKVTDKGMESLKGLVNMQDLSLHKCQVGDNGLKPLVGMLRLQRLDVSDTQVTRKGLDTIKKFTELQSLDMENCPLLDDGDLKHFLDLPQLQFLGLYGTSVTAEGMGRLRAAKPGLKTFP
jgi:hypothetical protein